MNYENASIMAQALYEARCGMMMTSTGSDSAQV